MPRHGRDKSWSGSKASSRCRLLTGVCHSLGIYCSRAAGSALLNLTPCIGSSSRATKGKLIARSLRTMHQGISHVHQYNVHTNHFHSLPVKSARDVTTEIVGTRADVTGGSCSFLSKAPHSTRIKQCICLPHRIALLCLTVFYSDIEGRSLRQTA